jgi:hypothetical protein
LQPKLPKTENQNPLKAIPSKRNRKSSVRFEVREKKKDITIAFFKSNPKYPIVKMCTKDYNWAHNSNFNKI